MDYSTKRLKKVKCVCHWQKHVAWLGPTVCRICPTVFFLRVGLIGATQSNPTQENRCVSDASEIAEKEKGSSVFNGRKLGLWKSERFRARDTFLTGGRGWPCWRTRWILLLTRCFSCAPQFLLRVPMISSIIELSKSFWRTL